MNYQRIAILGTGLLGGSLALACGQKSILWGRHPARVNIAANLGITATTELPEALAGADLLILAVPIGAMPSLIQAALPHLSSHTLVTDVGSLKTLPHQTIGTLLTEKNIPFIGSHPMAGSEKTGVEASDPNLFKNASCILTNDQNIDPHTYQKLTDFWKHLGCSEIQHMSADEHDQVVARISHLPHAIAALTAHLCLKNPTHEKLAGGGLRDTTRVASGDPHMWAEIMTENRHSLIPLLQETGDSLREMLEILEHPDQERLRQFLSDIKSRRDQSPLTS